uniref:Tubulin tyrosine ligase like 10 n=1 Tax=Prolemur simus TaxID=1328070 RepID=A0A8C8ZI74_PROSS
MPPTQGPRPRAAQGPRRGAGVASAQRGPRPSAPIPVARSHTRFIHCWGHPTRIQAGSRRSKRSRMWRCRAQAPGEREAAPPPPGPPGTGTPSPRKATLPDTEDAAQPPAALLEGLLLEEPKQPPGAGQGPLFYIGGTNGAAIISSYCKNKGWRRTQDSRCKDYKLKWCEVKCRDSYCSFREGEQLLFQLPNNRLLTTKIGLLCALREYSRVASPVSPLGCRLGKDTAPTLEELPWSSPGRLRPQRTLKMEEFFPETYRLDNRDEREAFFTLFDGIFLLRNQEEVAALQAKTQSTEDDPIYRRMPFRAPQARVVQRYIQNPLLLEGKKFDVRSYLVIACATPYMVFFAHGYARLTLNLYDPHSCDLSGHLTNQFMQKKSPLYVLLKEDTVWSMDHLNRYINDNFRKVKGLPRDWVFTTFTKRMQQIMAQCFLAVKSKLECKLGYFDLIGCDFLIDENFKVWLLEMNSNPALHTNCEVLKEVIPGVVVETLGEALAARLGEAGSHPGEAARLGRWADTCSHPRKLRPGAGLCLLKGEGLATASHPNTPLPHTPAPPVSAPAGSPERRPVPTSCPKPWWEPLRTQPGAPRAAPGPARVLLSVELPGPLGGPARSKSRRAVLETPPKPERGPPRREAPRPAARTPATPPGRARQEFPR